MKASQIDEERYAWLTRNIIPTAERRLFATTLRSKFADAAFNYDPLVPCADETRSSISVITTEYIICNAST